MAVPGAPVLDVRRRRTRRRLRGPRSRDRAALYGAARRDRGEDGPGSGPADRRLQLVRDAGVVPRTPGDARNDLRGSRDFHSPETSRPTAPGRAGADDDRLDEPPSLRDRRSVDRGGVRTRRSLAHRGAGSALARAEGTLG